MFNRPSKKELPLILRGLLVLVSILLCICLTISILATVLVYDLRQINNRETFRQVVDVLFELRLPESRMSQEPEQADDAEKLITQIIYEVLQSQDNEDMKASKEDIAEFVADSNISEFLTEKAVDFMDDLVNGTQEASVTTEELMELVLSNKTLLEETFGMTLDDIVENNLRNFFTEYDVGQVIHEQYITQIRGAAIEGDTTVGDVLTIICDLCDDRVFTLLIIITFVLAVALFFSNRMRLGGTFVCVGVCGLISGLILCLPLLVADNLPAEVLTQIPTDALPLLQRLLDGIRPVHFGVLVTGSAVLIVGIIIASISRAIRNRR